MSKPKHTEDKVGLVLSAFIPIFMIVLWVFLCFLGQNVHGG
jgi:hypothetical protein